MGDPGLISRSDAGLVTCQVHDHPTLRRCHRPGLAVTRLARPAIPGTPTRSSLGPVYREDTRLADRG